jgi:hypothetical protein
MYGSEGSWTQLFRHDSGHVRTELVREVGKAGRCLTLDFWISQNRYETFRKENRHEYKALDQECEALTRSEREVGSFVRVLNAPWEGGLLVKQIFLPDLSELLQRLLPVFRNAARIFAPRERIVHRLVRQQWHQPLQLKLVRVKLMQG